MPPWPARPVTCVVRCHQELIAARLIKRAGPGVSQYVSVRNGTVNLERSAPELTWPEDNE